MVKELPKGRAGLCASRLLAVYSVQCLVEEQPQTTEKVSPARSLQRDKVDGQVRYKLDKND